MALELPSKDRDALVAIQRLPSAQLDALVAALESALPTSNPSKLAEIVAPRLPGIPVGKLATFLDALFSLYFIRDLAGVKAAVFLDDLLGTLNDSTGGWSAKRRERLRSSLEKLLSIGPLQIISKAARLQRDGERLYCSAKLISDVRPVFGSEPSASPSGAVLTHTLRIGYHEGRDHREFYVVLDGEDLEALAEVIDRARLKHESLRKFLEASKLADLAE